MTPKTSSQGLGIDQPVLQATKDSIFPTRVGVDRKAGSGVGVGMGLLAALGTCLVYPIAVLLAIALVAARRKRTAPDFERPKNLATKTKDEYASPTVEELCAMYEEEDEEF
jgi:hypothetical protein